jgi:hypothetical protein
VSHSCDETYDVYDETAVRARIAHRCGACGETIRCGDRYTKVHIVFQASAETIKRCLRCQAIHEHLRGLDPGETWPDERLDCGQDYEADWGEPPPDEVARLAFLTADEIQALK